MTEVEKARERLAIELAVARKVVAEMRAAEVPEPQSVAEPVKRMMRGRGPDGIVHEYLPTSLGGADSCATKGCEPYVEAEPETSKPDAEIVPDMRNDHELALWNAVFAEVVRQQAKERAKKRTVSAEARKKIVYALWGYALWGVSVDESAAEELAARIIAIIEADGAEASA